MDNVIRLGFGSKLVLRISKCSNLRKISFQFDSTERHTAEAGSLGIETSMALRFASASGEIDDDAPMLCQPELPKAFGETLKDL